MKSIKDVIHSPQFLREISWLLFVFAVFNCILGILYVWSAPFEVEALALGIGGFLIAIVYAVLAFFIRRGSLKALWAAMVLFGVDTILLFVEPSAAGVLSRILLMVVLVRYIRRERASA